MAVVQRNDTLVIRYHCGHPRRYWGTRGTSPPRTVQGCCVPMAVEKTHLHYFDPLEELTPHACPCAHSVTDKGKKDTLQEFRAMTGARQRWGGGERQPGKEREPRAVTAPPPPFLVSPPPRSSCHLADLSAHGPGKSPRGGQHPLDSPGSRVSAWRGASRAL